ncbi:hypothetical protein C5167_027374 [Papaver somniferum]|nr:hypothetical protein C5167_027374 [Papaver somniferum]
MVMPGSVHSKPMEFGKSSICGSVYSDEFKDVPVGIKLRKTVGSVKVKEVEITNLKAILSAPKGRKSFHLINIQLNPLLRIPEVSVAAKFKGKLVVHESSGLQDENSSYKDSRGFSSCKSPLEIELNGVGDNYLSYQVGRLKQRVRQYVRVVKETDSKSVGLCLRSVTSIPGQRGGGIVQWKPHCHHTIRPIRPYLV